MIPSVSKIVPHRISYFVSTGEIEENVDLVPSRQGLLKKIMNMIEGNENFILPVIADVGTGKTHLYWALKHELYYYNVVYISLENVYRKFFYNTYSEFIENMGVEVLRSIVNRLCNEWGAKERKFGFFNVADIDKVRKFAREYWALKFGRSDAINGSLRQQAVGPQNPNQRAGNNPLQR